MTEITIKIERNQLSRYTDQYLALAWHVAQANPAPIEDKEAGELAEYIGREIVRRWLRSVEPEMWHHQGRHHYWTHLSRFAKHNGEDWVAKTPDDAKDTVHRSKDFDIKGEYPAVCGRYGKRSVLRAEVTCTECAEDEKPKTGDGQ